MSNLFLDHIVSQQTAFNNFAELIEDRGGYVPSIEVADNSPLSEQDKADLEARKIMANAYDNHMELIGDEHLTQLFVGVVLFRVEVHEIAIGHCVDHGIYSIGG